jgi:hypothetical protein
MINAVALHQRGQFAEAEKTYREVLTSRQAQRRRDEPPRLIEHQRGNHQAAIDLISRRRSSARNRSFSSTSRRRIAARGG